jgi:hypothetical protein
MLTLLLWARLTLWLSLVAVFAFALRKLLEREEGLLCRTGLLLMALSESVMGMNTLEEEADDDDEVTDEEGSRSGGVIDRWLSSKLAKLEPDRTVG